jgi:hypothetical protein
VTRPLAPIGSLLLLAALALMACGRTRPFQPNTPKPTPVGCTLSVSPQTLDFGSTAGTKSVTLDNDGDAACEISGVGLAPGTNADFFFQNGAPAPFSISPGDTATIDVSFAPNNPAPPLNRSGTLVFHSSDPEKPSVEIPLTAQIQTNCGITVSPTSVYYGHVALNSSLTNSVNVTNDGDGQCDVSSIAIANGSDPEFSLASGQITDFTLSPGQGARISVTFAPTDASAPHHRTGTLTFQSTDSKNMSVKVPLSADIDIGCDLTISPTSLSWGNVILNTVVNGTVTLGNDGSSACQVSGVALAASSDHEFSLVSGQATSFSVAPGGTQTILVTFDATDSAPPHLKTGTLLFQTGNSRNPNASIPLTAYINTICTVASQWIYTVQDDGTFAKFDPQTLTFTNIGTLSCPDPGGLGPFSMAVDQNAVAWVLYGDGNLFQVDTSTAACQPTTFQPNQPCLNNQDCMTFGMGFVFQPTTGTDTLYVAGGETVSSGPSTLATIAFPSLVLSPVGTVTAGWPELSGTGDGELWGFIPASESVSSFAVLVQIDPMSGASLHTYSYSSQMIPTDGDWAMKFWGGSFWIFLGTSVFQVERATPNTVTTAIFDTGRNIVGAGVSTCAPVQ